MAELITCRSGYERDIVRRPTRRPAAPQPYLTFLKLAFTSYWRRATSDPDRLSVVWLAADTLGASPPAKLFARE
jgi:hypothetical protein